MASTISLSPTGPSPSEDPATKASTNVTKDSSRFELKPLKAKKPSIGLTSNRSSFVTPTPPSPRSLNSSFPYATPFSPPPSRITSEHLKRETYPNFAAVARPDPSLSPLPISYQPHCHNHLGLSGGKNDLGALAMFEDGVKNLKSPKISPGPALSKGHIDCAFDLLVD